MGKLIPAVLAAYELRFLIAHIAAAGVAVAHGAGAPASTVLALILLGAGAAGLLRESGRGLVRSFPRPGWSRGLLRSWAVCSTLIAATLVIASRLNALPTAAHAQPLLHLGLSGICLAAPAVLLAGLGLAAALQRVRRWLLAHRHRLPRPDRSCPFVPHLGSLERRWAGAPIGAGWSDRGPPRALLAAL